MSRKKAFFDIGFPLKVWKTLWKQFNSTSVTNVYHLIITFTSGIL